MQIFGGYSAPLIGQKLEVALGSWFWCLRQEGHEGEAARNEAWACRGNAMDMITGKWKAEKFRNSENSARGGRRYV